MRERVSSDLLVAAVRGGTVKIISAAAHPGDLHRYDFVGLRRLLGGAPVIPSPDVERGMLYVNSIPVRR